MQKIIILLMLLAVAGCYDNMKPPAEKTPPKNPTAMQACPEQRPEMCTKIYAPVCATRDTGIRCVKAPCPSTENKTYGNSCTACADTKVYGYTPGACPNTEHQD